MEQNVLAAADHLRTQLGVFYWTNRRGDDPEIAARQLQTVMCLTERETSPWCLGIPQTVFARRSRLQLLLLLTEAKQVLSRLGLHPPPGEAIDRARLKETTSRSEDSEVFRYGPLT